MKTFKFLKAARVVVALLLFCLISAQFLDVYHSLGKTYWAANPTSLMYAPSLLKALSGAGLAAGWAFIAFSLAAFAFGRAYCSFACPFGILMDILRRISVYPAKSRLLKNTAIGKFCKKTFAALKYSPAVPFARWIFLALSAAAVAFGYGALFGFVEPYSLYGKIMGGIVHPAASVAVDESGRLLANFGVYSIPPVGGDPTVALASFAVAIIILVAIWAASALSGRIYCNTICPVGALLGLFSKAAVFRLSIDKSSCVSCGLCERNCKSKCIDSKGKALDFSRCVLCFNCAANPYLLNLSHPIKKRRPPTKTTLPALREFLTNKDSAVKKESPKKTVSCAPKTSPQKKISKCRGAHSQPACCRSAQYSVPPQKAIPPRAKIRRLQKTIYPRTRSTRPIREAECLRRPAR